MEASIHLRNKRQRAACRKNHQLQWYCRQGGLMNQLSKLKLQALEGTLCLENHYYQREQAILWH